MVDTHPCGGRPAFVGSGLIIEDSTGYCNTPILSAAAGASTNFVIATGAGTEMGDMVSFTGANLTPPSGTGRVTGIAVGTNVTLTVGVSTTGTGGAGGTLTVSYLKGTSSTLPRYDLKLLTQMSSSWGSPPTVIDLTTSGARNSSGFSPAWGACSVGNPDGFVNGTRIYIAFLVQDSANNCVTGTQAGAGPNAGTYYDLWACNLPIPFTAANITSGNCGQLLPSNQSTTGPGAFLDPHIWHNGHVYASERCDPSLPSCNTGSGGWPQWSIDDVNVVWGAGGTGTPPTASSVNRYQFGAWTSAEQMAGCEQFYKLTSVGDLPSGTVRGFFNANQVKNSYAAITSPPCAPLGGNNFYQDGIFYGDFNGAAGGANFTQIYPPYHASNLNAPATANCVTPGNNIQCYSEFPYVFHDMRRMVFVGSLFTQSWVIDACALNGSMGLGCSANYNNDEIQALLAIDYTQASFPMSVTAMARRTNYNTLGSPTCEQFFSPASAPTPQCGIAYTYYGDCSHLSVDEPTQLLACGMNTSASGSWTVVSPLASTPAAPFLSILYPGATVLGGVQSQ